MEDALKQRIQALVSQPTTEMRSYAIDPETGSVKAVGLHELPKEYHIKTNPRNKADEVKEPELSSTDKNQRYIERCLKKAEWKFRDDLEFIYSKFPKNDIWDKSKNLTKEFKDYIMTTNFTPGEIAYLYGVAFGTGQRLVKQRRLLKRNNC